MGRGERKDRLRRETGEKRTLSMPDYVTTKQAVEGLNRTRAGVRVNFLPY